MKTSIVILGWLLAITAGAAQIETSSDCEVQYLAGVEHFERGELQAAADSFFSVIRLAPSPETYPAEYIPYIYLSVAHYELGHFQQARDALIQSQVYGVAAKTETGKLLLERYAAKIMSAPLDGDEYVSTPQSSPVASNTYSLSENEVELIRAQVLNRCAITSKLEKNKLPWYFYYEFGVDLMKAGDAQRAVESFQLGANIKEDPSRNKRMYGMWYIDYLPYYQLALAHSRLGEWEQARDAILTSESSGEFAPADPDYESY
jgi:tetratricopeptide (TPR) repeat protein